MHEAFTTPHESSHCEEKQIKSHQGSNNALNIVSCTFCFVLILNHAQAINFLKKNNCSMPFSENKLDY